MTDETVQTTVTTPNVETTRTRTLRSNWEQGFLRSVYSESDGTGSMSRVLTTVVVVAVLGWITHVVIHMHGLPDLGGVTGFLSASVATLYGVNKVTNTINNRQ